MMWTCRRRHRDAASLQPQGGLQRCRICVVLAGLVDNIPAGTAGNDRKRSRNLARDRHWRPAASSLWSAAFGRGGPAEG